MMRDMIKTSGLLFVILTLWSGHASAQEAIPTTTSWSRIATGDIATEDGTTSDEQVIGGVSHERWTDDNGTHERDTQIIRYLDHEGKRLNKVDVTETLLDANGRSMVFIKAGCRRLSPHVTIFG